MPYIKTSMLPQATEIQQQMDLLRHKSAWQAGIRRAMEQRERERRRAMKRRVNFERGQQALSNCYTMNWDSDRFPTMGVYRD